eukprot:scaffold1109_cov153-Pinguiococcus_pyrenoidosus.AAC.2
MDGDKNAVPRPPVRVGNDRKGGAEPPATKRPNTPRAPRPEEQRVSTASIRTNTSITYYTVHQQRHHIRLVWEIEQGDKALLSHQMGRGGTRASPR